MLRTKAVNPWTWQDALGFSQAFEVSGAGRALFCSGQASVDAQGKPLHARDMAKQLAQAFDNLEAVLAKAGMSLANVVRLNYYTTDMPAFLAATPQVMARLGDTKPPGTLLGVAALFHPDLVIEIEATAVAPET
jgi:enamine deaminase RidA (YjgF/YER057c/UK114 family)